jgi:hypothetical protein
MGLLYRRSFFCQTRSIARARLVSLWHQMYARADIARALVTVPVASGDPIWYSPHGDVDGGNVMSLTRGTVSVVHDSHTVDVSRECDGAIRTVRTSQLMRCIASDLRTYTSPSEVYSRHAAADAEFIAHGDLSSCKDAFEAAGRLHAQEQIDKEIIKLTNATDNIGPKLAGHVFTDEDKALVEHCMRPVWDSPVLRYASNELVVDCLAQSVLKSWNAKRPNRGSERQDRKIIFTMRAEIQRLAHDWVCGTGVARILAARELVEASRGATCRNAKK